MSAVETAVAWSAAVQRREGPTSLLLSRQNLPHQARSAAQIDAIARGGYVLADTEQPRAVIIATGSEVALAMGAHKALKDAGIAVRVVSMPSSTVFDRQDTAYRASVLPSGLPRLAVEAGVPDFWRKYVGLEGGVIGLDRFGESAPAGELYTHFGFTVERVAAAVKDLV